MAQWLREHTTADVNYKDSKVRLDTPLAAACEQNHLDIVKYLVDTCHADINLPNRGNFTLLTEACRYVSLSVSIYLLLEVSDLDVNVADSDGNTALHLAVWCDKDHYTQLHEACVEGDVTEVWRLVCVSGHKINVQNNYGDTPLHLACDYGHSDIVETLIFAGADETITNDDNKTPSQVAEKRGHSELLKFLNGDSLWQVILWLQKKLLIVRLIMQRQEQMTERWCHTLTVFHVMLAVRRIIKLNSVKRYKLKRKANSII